MLNGLPSLTGLLVACLFAGRDQSRRKVLRDEYEDALYEAYTGEAKAALRLKVFAEKAKEEGYPQIAKLFRVIAFSEEIHGARALLVLGRVKSTEENLAMSFESETRVAGVAYDEFVKQAEAEGNCRGSTSFQSEQGCGRGSCKAL